jgi:phosphatidate cytidylyltransferase
MRKRFLLGPLLIAVLIAGVALDEYISTITLPAEWREYAAIRAVSDGTLPPGSLLLPVMFLVAVLGARELAAMLASKGIVASRRIMSLSAGIGLALSCLVPADLPALDAVAVVSTGAVAVLTTALVFHSRTRTVQGVLAAASGALLAFVYLGLMFGFLLAIRREHSAWTLLWVILVTKSCDIGAYLCGTAIGRHKLVPWLSPGKTWEGLIGGAVTSALVAWGGLEVLDRAGVLDAPPWYAAAIAGLIFGLVGQFGDLLESLIKRDAGAKDSGRSIPGFGGVLDVLDSPLLVAPVAFWWLRVVVPGSA